MRYLLALALVFVFTLYSCSSSEPEIDDSIVEVVDETATESEGEQEEEPEGEPEEEPEGEPEEDRWASYVHSSITVKPYYYPNSEIEYGTDENGFVNAEIVAGDKLVFYYYEAAGDRIDTITGSRLADSAYQIGLLFAIDTDKTEFKLENVDFNAAAAKYESYVGNSPSRGYFDITDGVISGTKINETEWEIAADITWTIPEDDDHEDIHFEYELSANFIPEPQE